MKLRVLLLAIFGITAAAALAALAALLAPAWLSNSAASGQPFTHAAPLQAGCYIAGPNDCRIHVDPFSIKVRGNQTLLSFNLLAIDPASGAETLLYDFSLDSSQPGEQHGDFYTASQVAQDFAATCGKTYQLSLRTISGEDNNGDDDGDSRDSASPSTAGLNDNHDDPGDKHTRTPEARRTPRHTTPPASTATLDPSLTPESTATLDPSVTPDSTTTPEDTATAEPTSPPDADPEPPSLTTSGVFTCPVRMP